MQKIVYIVKEEAIREIRPPSQAPQRDLPTSPLGLSQKCSLLLTCKALCVSPAKFNMIIFLLYSLQSAKDNQIPETNKQWSREIQYSDV
jgi:hypothetical protein